MKLNAEQLNLALTAVQYCIASTNDPELKADLRMLAYDMNSFVPARNPELHVDCPSCGECTYPDAYRTADEDQYTRICNGCSKIWVVTELVDTSQLFQGKCWMLMITPTGDYIDHLDGPEDAIRYVSLRKSALGDNKEGIQLYAVQELPLTPQSEPKTGGTRDFQEKNDE